MLLFWARCHYCGKLDSKFNMLKKEDVWLHEPCKEYEMRLRDCPCCGGDGKVHVDDEIPTLITHEKDHSHIKDELSAHRRKLGNQNVAIAKLSERVDELEGNDEKTEN